MYNLDHLNALDSRPIARRLLGTPSRSNNKYDRYFSPFRPDGQRPSLTVYPDGIKDYGGDGQYWSNIDFVQQVLTCSFLEACAWLSNEAICSPQIKNVRQSASHTSPPSVSWQHSAKQTLITYQEILWSSPHILAYLHQERGLSEATIRHYQLGYNPDWDTFRADGSECKVAPGIIIPWFAGDVLYAVRVRTRIGTLATYSGIEDSYLDSKYMSVTGSRPSAGLFGGDSIQTGQPIIITEGEFDAMLATQESGYCTVTRGSAGDHHHINPIWLTKLADASVVFGLIDTDEAGQQAENALLKQLDNFLPLSLPTGKDLSEYLLQTHVDMTDLFTNFAQAQTVADERRMALCASHVTTHMPEVAEQAYRLGDLSLPHHYTQRFARHGIHTVQDILQIGYKSLKKLDGIGSKTIEALVKSLAKINIQLDWLDTPHIQDWANPVASVPFSATLQVNLNYISDLDQSLLGRTNAIRSALGTGKTTLIRRTIENVQKYQPNARILVLTHLQALADNLSERLGITCYRTIPHSYRHLLTQVVCSYDSLHTVGDDWDYVLIDEHEQFHPHLISGTMTGKKPLRAYEKLTKVVKNAKRVMVLDAHLTDASIAWLAHLRGTVTAIENTFRHDWGSITIQQHDSGLIQTALQSAGMEDSKGVVVVSNQKSTTATLATYAREQFGTDAVMLINGDTSSACDVQAFIARLTAKENAGKALTTIFPQLKLLICSPSMATGIDVQAQISGVFGIFYRHHWMDSSKILQMMMRYRQADTRQLCLIGVCNVEAPPPSNTAQHVENLLARSLHTANTATFTHHHTALPSERLLQIEEWMARFNARREDEHKDFFSYVVAGLSNEGFIVDYETHEQPSIKEDLLHTREQRALWYKEQTLMAVPIDPQTLNNRAHTLSARALENAQPAVLRWEIEHLTAQSISEESYDLFHRPAQRQAFLRLQHQLQGRVVLQQMDCDEANKYVLLCKRQHITANRDLIANTIAVVFGVNWMKGETSRLTAEEIATRLTPFLVKNMDLLRMYILDRWQECSDTEIAILRRVLKKIGMHLSRKQIMCDGKRFYVYWLAEEHRDLLLAYARHTLQAQNTLIADFDSFIHVSPYGIYTKGVIQHESGKSFLKRGIMNM